MSKRVFCLLCMALEEEEDERALRSKRKEEEHPGLRHLRQSKCSGANQRG